STPPATRVRSTSTRGRRQRRRATAFPRFRSGRAARGGPGLFRLPSAQPLRRDQDDGLRLFTEGQRAAAEAGRFHGRVRLSKPAALPGGGLGGLLVAPLVWIDELVHENDIGRG